MLIVNVTTHHQDILFPLLQVRAVAHVRGPQELPVLQAEVVPVGVDDLDVVTRLLASVQLPEDLGPENYQETEIVKTFINVLSQTNVKTEKAIRFRLTKVLLTILSLALSSTFNPPTLPTMP